MFLDIQKYTRKLKIKRYFLSNPIMKNYTQKGGSNLGGTGLRNASLFSPPGKPAPSVTVFKELVLQDLQRVNFKRERLKNHEEGIASLCKRK